ncbi:Hypothetical predicted protein [Cloeon dipterum]|uniref:Uncharacterized protein n=1 Tax=Cloeon dipterum TaxID=197152 RepID=A0A8S1DQX4_9INSE|nr:Hypothetical predicted protein [Cloeon dipterum]
MTGLQRCILFGLQILVLLIALDGAPGKVQKTTTKRLTTTTTKKTTTTKPPTTTTPKKTTTTKPPITTTNTKTTANPPTTTTTKTTTGQTATTKPTITGETTTTKPTTAGETTASKPTTAGETTASKPTTTISSTPTPKILQCTSVDFTNLQTKCCNPPANNLLASSYNKTIETTCQTFGFDNSVFNVFVLNRIQIILKNYTVNITDLFNLATQLGQSACYIDCYLNQSGIIDGTGAFNVDALTTLLVANQDPIGPWNEIITMAVGQCTNVMTGLNVSQIIPPSLIGCSVTGGVIAQCVLALIVDRCPSRVTSSLCNTDYALYDECERLIGR